MKRSRITAYLTVIAFAAGAAALAPSVQDFDLSWYTIDGGGATFSTGEGFALGGTIGQADAGSMAGDAFVLRGGFWAIGTAAAPCPWDCDGSNDGIVSVTDLLALLGQYDSESPNNCTGGSCDFNGDGCVDVLDLLKQLGHYDSAGVGCP